MSVTNAFFTRMALNPARRGTRSLLTSPQRMHAAVMSSYPPVLTGEAPRVLWRVDRRASHDVQLYVVSIRQPDLTHLVEQAGWPTSEAWQTTSYGPFLDRLQEGQLWRFRITANPVQVLPSGAHGVRGKVTPLTKIASQEDWLRTQGLTWGFEVVDPPGDEGEAARGVLVTGRGQDAFSRQDPDERARRVTITRARFDGVLRVRDPNVLRDRLVGGMGRAKAYGCGLMTLAPVR